MEDSLRPAALGGEPHNLPVALTSFVGRQLELHALTQRLRQPSTRLLTLTGPGGSGKTRLALEVAEQLKAEFADGAWLVDLSLLGEAALVPSALAAALEIREVSGQPVFRRVLEHLRQRRLLLLLDNFEHLLGAAPLVTELLKTCQEIKVLATSRTPLGLYGEHEFPVQPLSVPDLHRAQTCAEIAQVEAVQLFAERARATRPDFQLSDANAAAVAEICVRLDGLPLALELAAAHVRLLPPAALLKRLERSLTLLTGGARDRPARHQTLRATIDSSYELLGPDEQRLFRQLGVFSGGFTLEAVETICNLNGEPSDDVLELLEAIGRASLVRQDDSAADTRFAMLETVREFAAERLEQSGEALPLRSRHADYFLALAERAEPLLHGSQQAAWLGRLSREGPNLRAALEFSLGDGGSERGVRLASALWWFWVLRGFLTEGRMWLRDAVSITESAQVSPPVRAKALYCAGYLANFMGDRVHGSAWSEAGLAACRGLGDERGAAYALSSIGLGGLLDGDIPAARAAFAEATQLFRATGDVWGLRVVLNGLGELERSLKNFDQAEALYVESLSLARQEQDAHGIGLLLLNLGLVALQQGKPPRAAELIREVSDIWTELGYRIGLVACLAVLASHAAASRRPELAIRLFSAGRHIGEQMAWSELEYDRSVFEHFMHVARSSLDPAAYDAAWASGKELTLEQAIAEGLAVDAPRVPANAERISSHEPLTIREWEVAQLVARGLTNRQIATELIVSDATVAKHVENIRAKLNLTSRTQVAAWVFSKAGSGAGA